METIQEVVDISILLYICSVPLRERQLLEDNQSGCLLWCGVHNPVPMCTYANLCRDTSGLRQKITKVSLTGTNECTVRGAETATEQQGAYRDLKIAG